MKPGSEQPITLVNIDKKLAIMGIVASVLLTVIALTIYKSFLLQQISITVLLASGVYLIMRRHLKSRQIKDDSVERTDVTLLSRLSPNIKTVLDISFWGLFISSLIILWQSVYQRPISFLILVAIMCAVVAVQIADKKNTTYCLIKIMAIGLLARGSAYYQFPTAIGTDPFIEMNFVKQIVASGHLGGLGLYSNYPLSYALDASIMNITGLGLRDSFFILSVIQVISLVFIFLIGKEIFNVETGLLSALIFAVFDWNTFWGFYVKGMIIGIALVPAILWLLLVVLRKTGRLRFLIIAIAMLLFIIFTHTYVNAAMAVILTLCFISAVICRAFWSREDIQAPIGLNLVLLFLVGTLTYWMFASGFITYIGGVVRYAMSIDTVTMDQVGIASLHVMYRSAAVLTWEKLPTLMLAFFFIFGFLNIININTGTLGQKKFLQVWIALVGVMFLAFNFILFYVQAFGMLEVARWNVFVAMIAVFPFVVGLLQMTGKGGWRKILGLFLLVFLISGIFLTSNYSNVVAIVPWEHKIRMAYTGSETIAANTVSRMAGLVPGQDLEERTTIYTDFYYSFVLRYDLDLPGDKIVDASPIFLGNPQEIDGIIMLRKASITEVIGASYPPDNSHGELTMNSSEYQSFVNDPRFSLIYSCGTVTALIPVK